MTATGLFHSHPTQPQEAVIVLKCSLVPAVTSIHSLPMVVKKLSGSCFTFSSFMSFLYIIYNIQYKREYNKNCRKLARLSWELSNFAAKLNRR